MEYRSIVEKFSEVMLRKLNENDDKGGWEECSYEYLIKRLGEEVAELAAITPMGFGKSDRHRMLAEEAADVANFAMMIADNAGAFSQK